jgi:thiamine transport system ATP-binding protein
MLSVAGVTVRFGEVVALDGVDVRVADSEIVALLGPSGCGKSTLLRAIAGLQPVADGRIEMAGLDLAGRAPHERGIGLMFQDHALFAHRDVGANVEFGLRMAGIAAAERHRRVIDLLDLVGLAGFGDRDVATLSGGEAQRVALARALAPRPRLLLLDEPLGSLDRQLRDRLVDELPGLLRELGIAALHVTHDHDEAFAIADRLVVMDEARVRRAGTPSEVWADPGTEEVARFLGHTNIVEREGRRVVIRADAATVDPAGELEVEIVGRRFRRGRLDVSVRTPDGRVLVFDLADAPAIGERLRLRIDEARVATLR